MGAQESCRPAAATCCSPGWDVWLQLSSLSLFVYGMGHIADQPHQIWVKIHIFVTRMVKIRAGQYQVSRRMWNNWDPHTLLVGMHIDTLQKIASVGVAS